MAIEARRQTRVAVHGPRGVLDSPLVPRRLARLTSLVGAIALALLAYSGQLGASPVLGWLPVNVTLFSAALVVGCSALAFLLGVRTAKLALVPMGLWAVLLVPVLLSAHSDYGASKVSALVTLTMVSTIAPAFLLTRRGDRVVFLFTLALAAVGAGVVTLARGDAAAAEAGLSRAALVLEGANTIGTSRILGTGAVILLVVALTATTTRWWQRVVCLAVGSGLTATMLATGSRGPLLGVALGIAVVLLVSPSLRRRRVRGLLAVALATAAAYWWSASRSAESVDRALGWITGGRDTSTQARQQLWDIAFDHAKRDPFGVGWGGFADLDSVPSDLPYPHNFVLEVLVEGGWLVGGAAVIFVIASLWRLTRQAATPAGAAVLALGIFTVTNAMASGDINDNRLMWMILSSAWVSTRLSQPQSQFASPYPISALRS